MRTMKQIKGKNRKNILLNLDLTQSAHTLQAVIRTYLNTFQDGMSMLFTQTNHHVHHCFVSIATAYNFNIILVFESTNLTKYLEKFK